MGTPILDTLKQLQAVVGHAQAAREEGFNLFRAGASVVQSGENLVKAEIALAARQAGTAIRESLDGIDGKMDARVLGVRIPSVNTGRSQE